MVILQCYKIFLYAAIPQVTIRRKNDNLEENTTDNKTFHNFDLVSVG
jgi:hypothetical protein